MKTINRDVQTFRYTKRIQVHLAWLTKHVTLLDFSFWIPWQIRREISDFWVRSTVTKQLLPMFRFGIQSFSKRAFNDFQYPTSFRYSWLIQICQLHTRFKTVMGNDLTSVWNSSYVDATLLSVYRLLNVCKLKTMDTIKPNG